MHPRYWLLGVGMGACGVGCGSDSARYVGFEMETGAAQPGSEEPPPESSGDGAGEAEPVPPESSGDGAGEAEPAPPAGELVELPGAEFIPGPLPAAEASDLLPRIVSLSAPAGVTNGGSFLLHAELDPPAPTQLFVLSVDGDGGYHHVSGSDRDGDGSLEIEVEVRAKVLTSPLVIGLAPTDGMGRVGEYATVSLELVPSGTGDVKVTLSFPPTHDLDLHVFEPGGAEVSFREPRSAAGGQLDLDSGANCVPSTAGAENIFWPAGAAPPGEYRVVVHDFEECERGAVEFSVRVENGPLVETHHRSFAAGAEGTSIEVARFTH